MKEKFLLGIREKAVFKGTYDVLGTENGMWRRGRREGRGRRSGGGWRRGGVRGSG